MAQATRNNKCQVLKHRARACRGCRCGRYPRQTPLSVNLKCGIFWYGRGLLPIIDLKSSRMLVLTFFPGPLKGNLLSNNTIAKIKKKCRDLKRRARACRCTYSTTVRVVRKKLVSCKIDVGGVGRCGAVRHRIAPAIGDMLRPSRERCGGPKRADGP